MPNLSDSDLQALHGARSELEWNSVCDQVKKRHRGQYPDDWYVKVVLSGLIARKTFEWHIARPGLLFDDEGDVEMTP